MRLLAILALLSFPVSVLSQEPATLKGFESAISKLRSQAKSALQRIEAEAEVKRREVGITFAKEAESIRKNFAEKMEKSQVRLTKQGDLDGALKARDEKKKIEDMNLALAEQTKSATQTEDPPAKTKDSKGDNRAQKFDISIFEGPWVNHGGRRLVFSSDGTVNGGYLWRFDPSTNVMRVVGSRSAWEYKIYLDGRFLDGVATKGPEAGKRAWLVKVR